MNQLKFSAALQIFSGGEKIKETKAVFNNAFSKQYGRLKSGNDVFMLVERINRDERIDPVPALPARWESA